MSTLRDRWAIVLAGGEGSRLIGTTVEGTRLDRPKQFCRIGDERTLLRITLDRALRLVGPERVVVLVCREHRLWWGPELLDAPRSHVLEQPSNRGSAVAILHAIVHILQHDPDPVVMLLPSDHRVEDEDVLARALADASTAASRRRRRSILLGIRPEIADEDYGWIVPGHEAGPFRSVRAFIEKPSRPTAAALMRHGALWNSFLLVSMGHALVDLFRHTQPELLDAYLENLLRRGWGAHAIEALYTGLEPIDFSRDLLEQAPERLDVLTVAPCGWTDLGTPRRVAEWLERHAISFAVPRRSALVPINAW
jgi:mannose-1-phosphate guanylyltransferase